MARTRDDARARRIELAVYGVAAVSYIVTGFFARSAVLNWIVGPAWFIAWVTLVTPLVLRLAGVVDPDGPGVALPAPTPGHGMKPKRPSRRARSEHR